MTLAASNPQAAVVGYPRPLQPGRVMNGKYLVVRTLGKGGMGTVYLAIQTIASRQRQVVIKEMLDYYDLADPQDEAKAHKRFEDEAAILVSLNFTNIPQIFDYFSEAGRNYIVMQFIPGRNLETGITHEDDQGLQHTGQPYPPENVRSWGIQLCRVLEYLATQNIVHMDIKPANLILDDGGNVWLVDFGTAKAQRTFQPGGQVGLRKLVLQRQSSVFGTAGYAPPEQVHGQVEPRADVYALAATLYHLLSDDDPRDHPFSFPKLTSIENHLAQSLRLALADQVTQRLSAAQFRQRLEVHQNTLSWQANLGTAPGYKTGYPFTWQDGSVSRSLPDLVQMADLKWVEARGYLYRGQFKRWLEDDLKRNDLARKVAELIQRYPDQDLGLEAFLHELAPSLPQPQVQISPADWQVGMLTPDAVRRLRLQVMNPGRGCALVGIQVSRPWLEVSEKSVKLLPGNNQAITVTVNAQQIPLYGSTNGEVSLQSATSPVQRLTINASLPRWRAVWQRWSPTTDWAIGIGLLLGATLGLLAELVFWIRDQENWVPLMIFGAIGAVCGAIIQDKYARRKVALKTVGCALLGGLLFWVVDWGWFKESLLITIPLGCLLGALLGALWHDRYRKYALRAGALGALAGSGIGFLLPLISHWITNLMDTPYLAIAAGIFLGAGLGSAYQLRIKPKRWKRPGLLTLIGLPLVVFTCLYFFLIVGV